MRYVGYSEFYHDAALAIVENDGTVAFASQSERYSGVKMDGLIHPPMWNMVNDDDHVTFYEDIEERIRVMGGLRTFGARNNLAGKGVDRPEITELKRPIHSMATYDDFNKHHESHAAYGYYTSPYRDAAVVVLDSIGEFETFTIWHGHGNKLEKKYTQNYPHSIGLFYSAMTQRCGFKANAEEHKLEQLAKKGNWRKNYRIFMEEIISDQMQ